MVEFTELVDYDRDFNQTMVRNAILNNMRRRENRLMSSAGLPFALQ